MIRAENITKKYITESENVYAVNDISLELSQKGMYMILGKSGCGKTTLLNMLSGLDIYDSGRLYVNDVEISCYNNKDLDSYHNLNMGIVFQEHNLISHFSVYDNLKLALAIQSWEGKTEDETNKIISQTLEKVGLAGYQKRKISQLSGGERQRVAIARVIVKQPEIIFADEPTGNLDVKTSKQIFELLKSLSKEFIVVVVTHDKDAAYIYGDTIYNISNGHIEKSIEQTTSKYFSKYSMILRTKDGVKQIDEVTYDEICTIVSDVICNADKTDTIVINNVCIDSSGDKVKFKFVEKNRKNKKVEKLPYKYKIQLAFKFLRKKKFSFIMTIVLMTISTILLYITGAVTFYDEKTVVKNYLNMYTPEILPCYVQESYVDDFYEEHSGYVNKGEFLYSLIADSVSEGSTFIVRAASEDIYTQDMLDYRTVTTLYLPSDYSGIELIKGRYIEKDNEIMITDYVATELGLDIGAQVYYNSKCFDIVGIVKTDYIAYNLRAKLSYGATSSHIEYYVMYRYNVVYLSSEYLYQEKKTIDARIGIEHSDFLLESRENSYMSSECYYDSASKIKEEQLIYGRLPQHQNEILVTLGYMESHSKYDSEEFVEEEYAYIDLYEEKYNNYYSGELNLYRYFSQGVKIVGIVDNYNNSEVNADIFIYKDKWNEIKEDYYEYYSASYLFTVKSKQYDKLLDVIYDKNIKLDEPAIQQIYEFANIIEKIKPVLYIVLVLTLVLDSVMLMTFIHISLRENSKNIGILRALGMSSKIIESIFQLEFWITHIVSIILSIPLIFIVQSIANNEYSKQLTENPYDIMEWNIIIAALIIAFKTIIGIISMSVPIRKYKKKRIIELMR